MQPDARGQNVGGAAGSGGARRCPGSLRSFKLVLGILELLKNDVIQIIYEKMLGFGKFPKWHIYH
jgi:hypothetical protein